MRKNVLYYLSILVLVTLLAAIGCGLDDTKTNTQNPTPNTSGLPGFASEEELVTAFTEGRNQGYPGGYYIKGGLGRADMAPAVAMESAASGGGNDVSYSDTNVQVAGVDEADVVKTDGQYIYLMARNSIYIVQAYPAESAAILAHIAISEFNPQELFIEGDRLMIFGTTYYSPDYPTMTGEQGYPVTIEPGIVNSGDAIMPYPNRGNLVAIKLYDIKDRSNPILLKSVDIEGSYLTYGHRHHSGVSRDYWRCQAYCQPEAYRELQRNRLYPATAGD